MLISIIIPSRNEKYLSKTINDLLKKSSEDIEIIAVLDGYWPAAVDIVDDERVHYIHFTEPKGMRAAINAGVDLARGEFILKTDAHCMFAKGFDVSLKHGCESNMVVVPRRLRLDPEKWDTIRDGRPPVDYMYLSYPDDPSVWGGPSLQGKEWREKNKLILLGGGKLIDDLMTAQGSCWFMKRKYFYWLELMDEENYGEFGKEMQEIGLKCWLSGGRMVRNKKTWYAHFHKIKTDGRGYSLSRSEFLKASEYVRRWLTEKRMWHKQTRDFEYLINKFWPIPGWPEDWRSYANESRKTK